MDTSQVIDFNALRDEHGLMPKHPPTISAELAHAIELLIQRIRESNPLIA